VPLLLPAAIFFIFTLAMASHLAIAAVLFLVAVIGAAGAYLIHATSDFVLTDRRVLTSEGWITRRSSEVRLAKIESLHLQQGPLGRLVGYGTLVLIGTGGTRKQLAGIEAAPEFHRRVQAAISAVRPAGAGT
jgi:uncharacterized membrane protein YdbT with pleckstrin-like domain